MRIHSETGFFLYIAVVQSWIRIWIGHRFRKLFYESGVPDILDFSHKACSAIQKSAAMVSENRNSAIPDSLGFLLVSVQFFRYVWSGDLDKSQELAVLVTDLQVRV